MARIIRTPCHFPLAQIRNCFYKHPTQGRGRSSGVERYLAKVNVVSSNLIARSKFAKIWLRVYVVQIRPSPNSSVLRKIFLTRTQLRNIAGTWVGDGVVTHIN